MMRPTVTLLAVLAALAACGRTGPPRAPGPANEIVYPRAYPAPPKVDGAAPTAAAPTAAAPVMPNVPLAVPTR